jgi:protein involved in polysaccharide export with SLBB domain
MIGVEFHGDEGKVQIEEVPLEPGMTVDDALTKAKAHKKFRRIQVDLGRTQGGQQPHKMAITYDNGKHHVSHTTNYALHPGDRVIVKKDNRTMMDDFMSSMLKKPKKRL